jgi:prepilin-type N-terminal cleavage/methylation domain-containing protein/prepilin-type processing-associated H-X9-DG protein
MAAAKRTTLEIRKRSKANGAGFTILELLVVISIIAILASIVLPALNRAKGKGYQVVCLNNQRQLALAWNLYPDDHEDYLPYNLGVAGTLNTLAAGEFKNWANNVMSWDLFQSNTNTAQLAAGGLGPYLSGVVQPFRCPSDRLLSNPQKGAGWRERTRSYSMNAMLGYPGEFLENGKNTNNPAYKQFFRLSEIMNPAGIFVFIEEHPDTIRDGYFLNKYGVLQWFDLPAAYHGGGANLSFADMHVEYRRWICPSTLQPEIPELVPYPIDIPEGERADYDWVMERMSYRTYYNAAPSGR